MTDNERALSNALLSLTAIVLSMAEADMSADVMRAILRTLIARLPLGYVDMARTALGAAQVDQVSTEMLVVCDDCSARRDQLDQCKAQLQELSELVLRLEVHHWEMVGGVRHMELCSITEANWDRMVDIAEKT